MAGSVLWQVWHWTHEEGLGAANFQNLPHSENTGLGTRSRHDLNVSVGGGESYNPNYVFSVLVDSGDAVWFGTWGAGVSHFDGEKWKSYSSSDGLAGNIVYSMLQDQSGNYWFGTNRGISRFDGKNWQTLGTADGLPGENIYALIEDQNGDIWAGATGAVVRISQNQEGQTVE